MEIFGVPVYLSFLSVVTLVPGLLGIVGALSIAQIRDKSRNSKMFLIMCLGAGLFQFAYTFCFSVLHPVGAYHRLLTIITVFTLLSAYQAFMMTYSEVIFPRGAKISIALCLITGMTLCALFIINSFSAAKIFRVPGDFWDFDFNILSQVASHLISFFSLLVIIFSVQKFRRMANRRNARTFLIILIAFSTYNIPSGILNILWRRGIITPETHYWTMPTSLALAFFTVYVIFLSHTEERSTVISNLLGITLVSILVLIPFLAYPLIEDRKASFRQIWAAKLQAGKISNNDVVLLTPPPAPLPTMWRGGKSYGAVPSRRDRDAAEIVVRGDGYFRDSEEYYRKALATIPSDGVILRADAAGGVYTFPVTIAGAERIVGIELVELRKYIHPTSAKLVLAQFIVILVIIGLFPLFFRGILLNPMRRLLDGVIAISRGRYGHRIENQRSDELGVISRHFDKMAVTIEASTTKLEETVLERTAQLTEEKKKSDTLLLNILPERIADELKEKGHSQPVRIESATVLFTDFVGFTKISENLTPEEVVAELDKCFSYFDQVTEKYGLEKLKTIGDSFMCAGGVPKTNRTHAIDACLAALEIQAFMNQMKEIKHQQGFPYWELRLGINSGPLVAGVVGHKKFAYDVWGDTVNTASRLESSGVPGKINISVSTYEAVKDLFDCEHRGQVKAKNKGDIDMYFLSGIRKELSVNDEGRVPNEEFRRRYKQSMRTKEVR